MKKMMKFKEETKENAKQTTNGRRRNTQDPIQQEKTQTRTTSEVQSGQSPEKDLKRLKIHSFSSSVRV